MKDQLAVQRLLQTTLTKLQSGNARYSLRAFAKKAGIPAGPLSAILNGKRNVSRKMAERIAARLMLDPTEKHALLKHFPERVRRKKLEDGAHPGFAGQNVLKLTADQFQMVSDWVHYAILSLIKTQHFKNDAQFIAERLGVTPARVRSALERLLRLEWVKLTPKGELIRTHAQLHTSDDVFSISIQKAHIQDMKLAQDSLLNDPVELRDFTSMTMPTSLRLLPKAKQIIRKAREDIADLLSSEPGEEVFRLSVYLYPLTQMNPNKETRK